MFVGEATWTNNQPDSQQCWRVVDSSSLTPFSPDSPLGFGCKVINALEFSSPLPRRAERLSEKSSPGWDLSGQTLQMKSTVWGCAMSACLPAVLSSPTQKPPQRSEWNSGKEVKRVKSYHFCWNPLVVLPSPSAKQVVWECQPYFSTRNHVKEALACKKKYKILERQA